MFPTNPQKSLILLLETLIFNVKLDNVNKTLKDYLVGKTFLPELERFSWSVF